MISLNVTMDTEAVRTLLVQVNGQVTDRRGLHEALALCLVEKLKSHFAAKNSTPNKMGAARTNFWNQIAAATLVQSVTANGAVVSVAEQRFNIHYFGGTILPKKARALTIPIIAEARGESVKSYELKTGHHLFSIPGRNVLFEKTGAGASESLFRGTTGRVRGARRTYNVGLAARTELKAVFALKASVTIKKDPDAIPSQAILLAALQQEANDFVTAASSR